MVTAANSVAILTPVSVILAITFISPVDLISRHIAPTAQLSADGSAAIQLGREAESICMATSKTIQFVELTRWAYAHQVVSTAGSRSGTNGVAGCAVLG